MKKILISSFMCIAFLVSTGSAIAQDTKKEDCKEKKECTSKKEDKKTCTKDSTACTKDKKSK